MKRIISVLLIVIFSLFLSSCTRKITSEEYDSLYENYFIVYGYFDDPLLFNVTEEEAKEALENLWKEIDRLH